MSIRQTDEALIKKVSLGDRDAFGQLVQRYLNFSLLYLKKRGCLSSEDLVQESFIKVWRFAKRYNSNKGLFKTWFFKILTRERINFFRQEKQHFVLKVDFDLDLIASDEDIQSNFEQKQSSEQILKQIEKLSPKLKEVFLLKYIDEFKGKEIADLLGISLKAVESRVLRAKANLIKEGIKNEQ
ncbi:MAG: RNA polymerase sigma factor [Alphaproteobacteria bacterium]